MNDKTSQSYDSIELQRDLINIFGDTSSVFPGKPDSDSIKTVFTALNRLCRVQGNLQYYFRLMYNIM